MGHPRGETHRERRQCRGLGLHHALGTLTQAGDSDLACNYEKLRASPRLTSYVSWGFILLRVAASCGCARKCTAKPRNARSRGISDLIPRTRCASRKKKKGLWRIMALPQLSQRLARASRLEQPGADGESRESACSWAAGMGRNPQTRPSSNPSPWHPLPCGRRALKKEKKNPAFI